MRSALGTLLERMDASLERMDASLERVEDSRRVESAFKAQAVKAQRAYIQANRMDPRSPATEDLRKLHREALSQWAKAQADAGEARRGHAARFGRLLPAASAVARSARGGRNGSQGHSGSVRPLEAHNGRPG